MKGGDYSSKECNSPSGPSAPKEVLAQGGTTTPSKSESADLVASPNGFSKVVIVLVMTATVSALQEQQERCSGR